MTAKTTNQNRPLPALLRSRAIRWGLFGWGMVNVALFALAGERLPFAADILVETPSTQLIVGTNLAYLEIFVLMGIAWALTRRRPISDIAARAPERHVARNETAGMLAYGVAALAGGSLLAQALGWTRSASTSTAWSFARVTASARVKRSRGLDIIAWPTRSSRTCGSGAATPTSSSTWSRPTVELIWFSSSWFSPSSPASNSG